MTETAVAANPLEASPCFSSGLESRNGFLASVCSVEEAELAMACEADIIDCKDPRHGALGGLPSADIRAIVQRIDGRRPVSATIGDLPNDPNQIVHGVRRTAACGVDFVKLGFFEFDQSIDCIKALQPLATKHRLIAVFFADRFDPTPLIPWLTHCEFAGVMIDTASKAEHGLTRLWDTKRLAAFVQHAQEQNLLCGLAGKLQLQDIPDLLSHQADYLGFRSALCHGERTGAFDATAMHSVRSALRLATPGESGSG